MGQLLSTREFETTRELHRFKADLFELLARHFGGSSTLNHLRVGNFIGLCSQYEGRPTSNVEIPNALQLSRSTVSRIVADFVRTGWVTESPHPDDGRRRLLVITPDHPREDEFERALRGRLNELMDQYAAGRILRVDPDKKSFLQRKTPP